MIRTKEIYSKICNAGDGKILSREDLKKLQNHLFKMYRDVEEVCHKHGIEICLAYGNVLGAVRHNGWIPWDDDLDIHMMREDYDKFMSEYYKELPSNYKVNSYLSKEGASSRFGKIYDTNTILVPLTSEKNEESCCYLDVFPIDNVPKQPIRNKLRRILSLFLLYTEGSVEQVESASKKYKNLMFSCKEGKRNWRFRQAWGRFFSFFRHSKWNAIIENFGKNKTHSGFLHVIPVVTGCYIPMKEEIICPFKKKDLSEIGNVNIPNKAEEYLDFYYGDWRKVPEDTDKWHHYVSEFYIPDENSYNE